jgi:hypothetical protein
MNPDIVFTSQIVISMTTISFAMYMLAKGKDAGVYLPIITGVTASWLPAPGSTKTPNQNRNQNQNINHRTNPLYNNSDIEQPLLQ